MFVWKLIIKLRLFLKKESPERYKEKFAVTNAKKEANLETIWIHAVSVGEMNSAEILIKELSKKYFIVLTTTSLTSAKLAENFKYENFIHQFNPIDSPFVIKKFLTHWNVKKAIFIESEFWPFTIYYTSKVAQIYLINARFSSQSYNMWYIFKYLFFKKVLNCYTKIFPSGDYSRKKFESFGINNIGANINTKIFNKEDFIKKTHLQKNFFPILQEKLKEDPQVNIFSFISLHLAEVEEIKEIIEKILKENPKNKIIILPRKINESEEILNAISSFIEKRKITIINQQNESILKEKKDTKIFILNEMGIAPFIYSLTDIPFVCGSFVKGIGGHNPLEGIFLYKKAFFGNFYHKNIDLIEDLKNHDLIEILKKENLKKLSFSSEKKEPSEDFKLKTDNFFKEKNSILKEFLKRF